MFKKLFKSPVLISAVIAILSLIVFSRVLSAGFVMWDDDRMVYLNPNLSGLSLEHLGWIFTHEDATRRYTPLAALNYSITYQISGLNPFGYHFSPWLFHGVSAGLLFLILRRLLNKGFLRHGRKIEAWRIDLGAAAGALLWSLHPLRTEVVAWVGAGFYSQAMFFLLLSLLCYLWADEADINSKSHLRRVLMSAGLFAAAILSHPIVIGFFIVFIVLDIYPLGKIKGRWWKTVDGRKVLAEKIPFVAAALIISAVTILIRVNDSQLQNITLSQFGILDRTMQAFYIWGYYIWRPLYPVNLAPVYTSLINFDPLSLPFLASATMVIGGFAVLILLQRRWPLGLTLGVCYLVMLVPVLGFLEHPYFANDRYSILVSICFSVLLAVFVATSKTKARSFALIVLSVAVIATLGILSWRQVQVWNNSENLFVHTIDSVGENPSKFVLQHRLGLYYFKQGRYGEGIELLQKNANPVQIKKESGSDVRNGIAGLIEAGQLVPYLAKVRDNPGKALVTDFQIFQALEQFLASNLDPAIVHSVLGNILFYQGRFTEAADEKKRSLEMAPNNPDVENGAAWLFATCPDANTRNPSEAIRLAEEACIATNHGNAGYLDTLGAAYASAGKFTEAIEAAEKALNLADENRTDLRRIIQGRLDLYKAGRAYIEPVQKDQNAK
jgi:tetratricopeptide (TPR) repeat protein